jgi:hypothetical protein
LNSQPVKEMDLTCPISLDKFDEDPISTPCCGNVFSREPRFRLGAIVSYDTLSAEVEHQYSGNTGGAGPLTSFVKSKSYVFPPPTSPTSPPSPNSKAMQRLLDTIRPNLKQIAEVLVSTVPILFKPGSEAEYLLELDEYLDPDLLRAIMDDPVIAAIAEKRKVQVAKVMQEIKDTAKKREELAQKAMKMAVAAKKKEAEALAAMDKIIAIAKKKEMLEVEAAKRDEIAESMKFAGAVKKSVRNYMFQYIRKSTPKPLTEKQQRLRKSRRRFATVKISDAPPPRVCNSGRLLYSDEFYYDCNVATPKYDEAGNRIDRHGCIIYDPYLWYSPSEAGGEWRPKYNEDGERINRNGQVIDYISPPCKWLELEEC